MLSSNQKVLRRENINTAQKPARGSSSINTQGSKGREAIFIYVHTRVVTKRGSRLPGQPEYFPHKRFPQQVPTRSDPCTIYTSLLSLSLCLSLSLSLSPSLCLSFSLLQILLSKAKPTSVLYIEVYARTILSITSFLSDACIIYVVYSAAVPNSGEEERFLME